ncbi:MAG TPA: hypothetical protein VK624_20830 [Steroidobacteraceae bacterium]|nr:hypothetical protein [Steroidobacteraceae bacterium]
MTLRRSLICIALALGSAANAGAAGAPSFNEIVAGRIQPQLERLVQQLVKEGRAMRIDGTPVFNGSDKFLPGKIALAFSDVISSIPVGDPRVARYVADFRRVADLTVDDPNDSWGIYYYLSALAALDRAGQLKAALDPLTLAKLRVRLDWRTFVDRDSYALIEHPNNYYCVAFAIARLRNQLRWEDGEGAQRLYAAMTAHYREYSGDHGFADETDGEGRFDRYSVLLAGEIAQRFMETGDVPPAEVIGWLRKSATVMLPRLNSRGEGFEYGRSLGPYSETAIIEVLTAAAVLNLLDDDDKALAYAYASRASQRYADFWLDARTGSVNLWDQGRRTDQYRGKFRILGENFSLGHQYVYTNAAWNRMGYRDKPPLPDFDAKLQRLPGRSTTWFARGKYDRMLLTLREGGRVIGLPLINGGVDQHMHVPYFPIPFSPGMLDGVADGTEPFLLPRFELEDGSVLMPLAYFRDITVSASGQRTQVTYRQMELDRMGGKKPAPDDRLGVTTTYVFEPGIITRTDVYTAKQPIALKSVVMAFGSHSGKPVTSNLTTRFGAGDVREFRVAGMDSCESAAVLDDIRYHVAQGALRTKVNCVRKAFTMQEPVTIRWELRYRTH